MTGPHTGPDHGSEATARAEPGDFRGRSAGGIRPVARRCPPRQVDELFRAHGDFLRRLARRLCRSAIDPEDLLQDVFERAMLHAHTLVPDMDHRAWLARVMRNLFIDRLRRRTAAPAQATLEDE